MKFRDAWTALDKKDKQTIFIGIIFIILALLFAYYFGYGEGYIIHTCYCK